MDSRPGPPFCKWHQDGQDHPVKRLEPARTGKFVTRAEFGEDLYEAVYCCGALLELDKQEAPDSRIDPIRKRLAAVFPKLGTLDQEAILLRYPTLFERPL
jgi:hypothetical protein